MHVWGVQRWVRLVHEEGGTMLRVQREVTQGHTCAHKAQLQELPCTVIDMGDTPQYTAPGRVAHGDTGDTGAYEPK